MKLDWQHISQYVARLLRQEPEKASAPANPPFKRRSPIPGPLESFFIPVDVLEQTQQLMRSFGEEERECYVWWGGYCSHGNGQVLSALYPDVATTHGSVRLDNSVLRRMQRELFDLDQLLLIELHSHPPGAGGQNEVDAAHPAAPYQGFITMVVPDFGFVDMHDLSNIHIYEYIKDNMWRTLESREIKQRFVIDPSIVAV